MMRRIVLAVVLGTLFAGLAVYVSSGRQVSFSGAPGENAEVAITHTPPPQRDAPVAPVATTRRASAPAHAPSPPLVEDPAPQPPSAECLALRAEEAAARSELAALTPDEVAKLIDTEARESVAREQAQQQALETCAALTDAAEREQCLQAMSDVLSPELTHSQVESRAAHEAGISGLREAVRQLAANGDARTLVAATAMLPFEINTSLEATDEGRDALIGRQDIERARWLVRAQSLAPDDALVQWAVASRLGSFGKQPAPDLDHARLRAIAQLQRLEPGNAAVEMLAIDARSGGRRGDLLDNDALKRLAAMPAYREPALELMNLVIDRSAQLSLSSETLQALRASYDDQPPSERMGFACASDVDFAQATALAMGITSVIQLDHSLQLATSCRENEAPIEPVRRRDCLKLAELFYRDTRLLSSAGLAASVGARLAPPGPERERWVERRRSQRWQIQQYTELTAGKPAMTQVRESIAAWRSGGEWQAQERALRDAGIPLNPPADWQPDP